MTDFLFISNGHGEDAIAAGIAEQIPPSFSKAAFPLVGEGSAYRDRGIPVLRSFPPLPSGGLSLTSDLKNGLLPLLKKEWQALAALRGEVSHAVAVGDIFPCVLARFALKQPFSFVGTAKSIDVQSYNFFERWILRKAKNIFTRDQKTADALRISGLKADWTGNPMMDETVPTKVEFSRFPGRTIAILPGSRSDAQTNLMIQAEALHGVARRLEPPVRGIVALSSSSNLQALLEGLRGWDRVLVPSQESGIIGQYVQGEASLYLTLGCLGDALRASSVVFGQAGTANEEAAGIGKPVIAFDYDLHRNGKLSWYRWRQKRLLGDALAVVAPNGEALAEKGVEILKDRLLYGAMSDEGKKRMGPPGASKKIASILAGIQESSSK